MSSGLFFDNKKYISAKEASLLTSYSKDYIGQLCRADKIDCKQIGRIWYVSEESILNYKNFPTTFSSLKDQYIPVEKKVTSQVPVFTSAPTQQKSESVKTTTLVKIVNFVKNLISPKVFDAVRVYASSNYSPLRVVGTVAIVLVMLVGALTVKDGIVAFADTSSQLAEIMPRVVQTVLARTVGLPENISNRISSAPMTAYDEMDNFTNFYSYKLAVVYSMVGKNIFATANSSTEAIITFAKNPPLQIVKGINALALGEKKIVDRTAVSTKNIALAVHAQTFAFISDSFGGVSDVRQSTQTLSASVAFAVNRTAVTPVDRAGVTVYEKVNSWFDRGVYAPIASLFNGTPAIVNTVYVAQQVTPQAPKTSPKVIAQNTTTKLVTTKVIEKVTERVVASDLSKDYLEQRLQEMNNNIMSKMSQLSTGTGGNITNVYNQIAQSQRIDQLSGVAITNSTFNNGSLSNVSVGATSLSSNTASLGSTTVSTLAVTGSATSTFANGVDISSGCFSVNGVCVGSGGSGSVGAGVAGQFGYYATDGTILTATSSLFISTSTGYIGIGTTSPYRKFSVDGDAVVNGNFFSTLLNATTGVIDTFSSTVATITGLTVTNSTTTNATTTNAYITRLVADNATTTNLFAGNISANTIIASTSASFGTTTVTNLAVTNTSTSTIAGALSVTRGLNLNSGYIFGAGLTSCSGSADKLIWNSATGQFGCGLDAGSSGGLTGLAGQYSPFQTGSSQTFATSSDANIGLTITSSGNVHTFTPTWSGVLSVARGGTNISSPVAAGVLLGDYTGTGYMQLSTSSLGLMSATAISSGLQGQVPFYNANGTNLTATSSIFIAQNGRIGIGTTSPIASLDVGGAISQSFISNFTALANFSTNVNGIAGVQMANTNSSGTNADFRFLISDTGTTTGNYIAFAMPGIGNTNTLFGQTRSNIATIFTNQNGVGNGRILAIGTVNTNDVLFGTNNLERVRITSTGNVAIGTSTAFTRFAVFGDSLIAGTETASSFVATSTTATSTLKATSVTNLAISNNSGLLKAGAGGYIVNALAGVDYQAAGTYITALGSGYASTTNTAVTFSTSTLAFNGLTIGQTMTVTGGAITVTPTVTGTLNNAGLTNSTISGISLGSNLANLTATDSTLTFSGSYNGGTARTVGLNLSNPNTWTALQTFNYSSSTAYASFVTASTTNLIVNGQSFNNLLGSGLLNTGNALTLDTTFLNTTTNSYINASTTIPKTYTANTFTNTNTFNGTLTYGGTAINSLLSTNASGQIVATSTPTFGFFNATSTTATSTIAGGLAIGTNKFVVDRSTGNVGVGTQSPTQKLQVSGGDIAMDNGAHINFGIGGSVRGGDAFISLQTNSADRIVANYGGSILFGNENNQVQMVILPSGDVGIGSTSPWGKLSVNNYSAGVNTAPLFVISSSTGALATSTQFIVTSTGNVGVGTSSPSARLSVSGDGYISNALGVGIVNTVGGTLRTSGTITSGGGLTLLGLLNCNASSQALQTDGSGIVSCGSITGGGASVGGGWTSISPNIVRLSTTTDLVGMGTTSPYAKLSINSGSTATTTLALVPVSGQVANILDIYNTTGGLQSVITASGKFGIGTSSPQYRLDVNGGARIVSDYNHLILQKSQYASSANQLKFLENDGTELGQIWSESATWPLGLTAGAGSTNVFAVNNAGTVNIGGTDAKYTPAMSILQSGNVGIGTTTPNGKLEVAGQTNYNNGLIVSNSGNVGAGIDLRSTGTGGKNYSILSTGSANGPGAGVFGIFDGSNYVLTIKNGNVGIGTTGANWPLEINGAATSNRASIRLAGTGGSEKATALIAGTVGSVFEFDNSGFFAITGDSKANVGNGNGTQLLTVLGSNGNVGIGTTSPYRTLSVVGSGVFTGGNVLASTFTATSSITTPSLTLSSVAINSLLSTDASGNIIATSTPTFGFFNATSTTATSTIAGGLAIGTNKFVVDRSTGNVGVGTTNSNGYKLNVAGSIFSDNYVTSASGFTAGGNGSTGLLGLWNSSSEQKVNITSTGNSYLNGGNLGIGTTSPFAKLSVHANNGETNSTLFNISSSTASATTSILTVLNNGNVGIGTASPTSKLYVNGGDIYSSGNLFSGNLTLSGGNGGMFYSSTVYGGFYFSNAGTNAQTPVINAGSTGGIGFDIANNRAVQISSSGNIGIGTTTPLAKLNVYGGDTVLQTTVNSLTAFNILNAATTSVFSVSTQGFGTTTLSGLSIVGQATSTSNVGINLTGGCFAVGGNCIGGSSFTNTLANGGTATTTFYNGGVVFSDATKLTQSSSASNFFWDETNKRLGLGTSTPFAKLSVNSIAGEPSFVVGSSTATSFIVDKNGNVGVGTVSPTQKLELGPAGGMKLNSLNGAFGVILKSTDSFLGLDGLAIRNQSDTSYASMASAGFFSAYSTVGNSGGFMNNDFSAYRTAVNVSDTGTIVTASTGQYGWSPLTGFNFVSQTNDTGLARLSAGAVKVTDGSTGSGNLFAGNIGVATTTLTYPLSAYSATTPQLALSAGGGLSQWTMRNAGGNLYFSTTTVAGTATTSTSAFSISGSGFGTTTLAGLSIVGQATSTSNVGINLTGGCFAVGGNCLTSYSDTLVNSYIAASTTIPKTYTANTFTNTNTFNGTLTYGATAINSLLSTNASGQIVATSTPTFGFFNATSTTATSTIAGGLSVAGTSGLTVLQNGRVGVGTASPGATLEVNGTAILGGGTQTSMPTGQAFFTGNVPNGDMSAMVLYNAGGGAGSAVSLDFYNTFSHSGIPQAKIKAVDDGSFSDDLVFLNKIPGASTNALAERMRLTSIGNLGIGTTSPYRTLSVAGSGVFTGGNVLASTFTATSSITTPTLTLSSVAINSLLSTDASGNIIATSTPTFGFFNATSTTATSTIAGGLAIGTNKFVVDYSSGNVGIGTASPGYTLSVAGNMAVGSTVNAGTIYFGTNGNNYLACSGTTCNFNTNLTAVNGTLSGNLIVQGVANSSIAGNLGIGTTSPFAKLSVHANNGETNSQLFTIASSTASATTTLFTVLNNGNVGIGNPIPTNKLDVDGGTGSAIYGKSSTGNAITGQSTGGTFGHAIAGTTDFGFAGYFEQIGNIWTNYTSPVVHIYRNNILNGFDQTGAVLKVESNIADTGNLLEVIKQNSTKLVVKSSGNLGIGTTSPYRTLSVAGSGVFTGGNVLASTFTATSSITTPSLNLSSVAINSLLSTDASGNIIATSTPTFGFFNATSTTATSTIAGGLAIGTNKFVVDRSTGNVGIGTTSPSAALTVGNNNQFTVDASGNIIATGIRVGATYSFDNNGIYVGNFARGAINSGGQTPSGAYSWQISSGNSGVYNDGFINFNTSGSERMRIIANGNLGIGTTSPFAKLSVHANNGETNNTLFNISSSTASATTSILTVLNNGNVGIGTANPAYLLDVNGTINSSFLRTATVDTGNNGGLGVVFGGSTNYAQIATNNTTNLFFSTNGSERMRITTGGNIGIGTTTPLAKLNVYGGDTVLQTTVNSLSAFNILNAATTSVFSVSTQGFGTTTLAGLSIVGQATSTSNVGINLTGGCFAVGGNCIGGSSFTNTLANGGTATTTFYNGGVVFSDATKLTQSSSASNFFWDETNKRLGLGTSTPFAKLSVNSIAGEASFVVGSSTATSFIVDKNGNVGVGTVSPGSAFQLGTTGAIGNVRWVNNGSNSYLGIYDTGNTTYYGIFPTFPAPAGVTGLGGFYKGMGVGGTTVNGANPIFGVMNSGQNGFSGQSNASTYNSSFIVLDNQKVYTYNNTLDNGSGGATFAGNLGIGTTSPYRTLSVVGSGVFTGGNVLASTFTATSSITTPSLTLSSVAINSLLSTDASGNIIATSTPTFGFFNATSTTATSTIAGGLAIGTNKFVVDRSTGNVGVGTASPADKLDVAGRIQYNSTAIARAGVIGTLPVSTTGLFFGYDSGADRAFFGSGITNGSGTFTTRKPAVFDSSTFMFTRDGSTSDLQITSGGNVIAGSGIYAGSTKALTVAGDIRLTGAIYDANDSAGTLGMVLQSTGTGQQWVATSTLGITGGSGVSGGVNGYVARFTSPTAVSTGLLLDNGTVAGVNATSSSYTFNIQGSSAVNPFNVASSTGLSLFNISANGRVGIGTTSPNQILSVVGNVNTTGSYMINNVTVLNATGTNNTLIGKEAGVGLTTGTNNFFAGFQSGFTNSSGVSNTFIGNYSGYNNNANYNTFLGYYSGNANTSGSANFFGGYASGQSNQGGSNNTFLGYLAGSASISGADNVFVGHSAGQNNSAGASNVFVGKGAGLSNNNGGTNVYVGYNAGTSNGGSDNVLLGNSAGANLTGGSRNIVIGSGLDALSASAVNTLNIGNFIYGTGLNGTGSTISNGFVGIGTSSPYATLSVAGWVVADYFNATSTTATSTFSGGFSANNGAIISDFSTGVTSIDNLQLGSMNFDTDAGMISWVDMPVSTANATGTVMSYTAQLAGNPLLSVYGTATGYLGGTSNMGVGIGTTTTSSASPLATLSVQGFAGTNPLFDISSSTGTSLLRMIANGNLGIGTTSPYRTLSVAGSGVFTGGNVLASTFTATSSITTPSLTLSSVAINSLLSTDASGNIVATSTPTFGFFNATSTTATSTIAGGLAIGTNKFVVDRSTGNVGVGVANPTASLSVNRSMRITNGSANGDGLTFDNGTSVDIFSFTRQNTPDNGSLSISAYGGVGITGGRTSNSPAPGGYALYVAPGGNVGVGTTTPWAQLSVNPSGVTGPVFAVGSSTATSLIVTNGGNVGIGLTAPTAKLDVLGSVNITDNQVGANSLVINVPTGVGAGNFLYALANRGLDYAIKTENQNTGGTVSNIMRVGSSDFAMRMSQISGDNGRVDFSGEGGSIAMSLMTATGNIGLATTTPKQLLTLQGTATVKDLFNVASTTGASMLNVSWYGGFTQNISSTTAVNIQDGNSNPVFTIDTTQISSNAGIDITAGGSQTGNLLNMYSSGGTFLSGFTAAGGLLMNISSTTAIQIQNGSAVNVFTVDTVNKRLVLATTTSPTLANDGEFLIGDAGTAATNGRIWIKSNGTTFRFQSDNNTADYSEYFYTYATSSATVLGTIMTTDTSTSSPVAETGLAKPAQRPYDKNILGVVSGRGTSFNNPDDTRQNNSNFTNVGMLGHVFIRVSSTTEAIHAGDYLTSSAEVGLAMKATRSGMVVGQALQDYNPAVSTSTNMIIALVKPGFQIINNTFVLGEDDAQIATATSTSGTTSSTDPIQGGLGMANAGTFLINQKGSGNILQLQQNGQDRFLVNAEGSVSIIAGSASSTASVLAVRNTANVLFAVDGTGQATFTGHIVVSKNTSGTATIKSGDNQTTVTFDVPYVTVPKIVATMSSGLPDFFYGVTAKSPTSFVISTSKPVTADTTFDWVALVQNDNTTSTSSLNPNIVTNPSSNQTIVPPVADGGSAGTTPTDTTGSGTSSTTPAVGDTGTSTPVTTPTTVQPEPTPAPTTEPVVTTPATTPAPEPVVTQEPAPTTP